MTALSYHDTIEVLQGLPFTGRGPFARTEWFALLEHSGARPFVALARDGGEALALPLARAPHGLTELSNWYAFTWTGLATLGARREALLERLARDLPAHTSRLTLSKLPDEDGTATRFDQAFRRAGWTVLREVCDTNHTLAVAGRSFADYLATRPGPLRTTLQRKGKRVAVDVLTSFDPDAWQAYERIYRASWKPAEGNPTLLRRFAAAEGSAGRLRVGLARHEGTVVAAQLWTVEDGTAYIHKLAHDEGASRLSAGTVLTAALLAHVIDSDHVATVDFGTGDDPYKRDWMDQVRPRWRLDCLRAGDPRTWPVLARALARKLVSRPHAG